MKISCKNIPTYSTKTKKWTTTSFKDQYEFGDFLLKSCFKEPGNYEFDKELTKKEWNKHANKFIKDNTYTDYSKNTTEYQDFWDTEELKCIGCFWYDPIAFRQSLEIKNS